MIDFAAYVLGMPLDPWQQWLVVRMGELLPDGRPRFRRVLVLVARQNGKTHLCTVLALFWLFIEKWPMLLATSSDLEQAAEAWEKACDLARETPALERHLPPGRNRGVRRTNGQQTLTTTYRTKYKIKASNSKGGRGKSPDRIIGDELREQRDWIAYAAAYPAMNARPHGQAVWISNQGDSRSVVLNTLRREALDFIETGEGDERLGIFEWSAPAGSHPTDVHALAAANPQLGRRMDYDTVLGPARNLSKPGADQDQLAAFLTEVMCMSVSSLEPAFNPAGWETGRQPAAINLADRARLAACVDVAPDLHHVTLCVAVDLGDGKVRVEAVAAWSGPNAMAEALDQLPQWLRIVRPRRLGWFPNGPAATLDASLRDRRKDGRTGWPPRGVTVAELGADAPAIVMSFAERIEAGAVLHSDQDLLNAQVDAAEKLGKGDRWIVTRRGAGHVDGVYAAAGAVFIARTMPRPRKTSRRVHVGA